MKIFHSILTVGGFTSLSRILGLLRDTLITALIGAGAASDVFWVAFRLPNFFRRLLAEGAMAASFVPLFSNLKVQHGYKNAIQGIRGIHTFLILILLLLVIAVEMLTPSIVIITAPGFYGNEQQLSMVIDLARIMFPYIFFISLAAFYGSILNTEGKFASAAVNPVILNIAMIGALLISNFFCINYRFSLAYSVIISGILQVIVVLISLKKLGALPAFAWPRVTPIVKLWLKGMAPGFIGAGAMQINTVIDMAMASYLPAGSISYLFFADRLNQLPLGLLGIGISTVLLPHLSRKISEKKHDEAKIIQSRTIEYTMLFTIPAALALGVLGCDIICVLYERGQFDRVAVLNTGYALSALSVGLPAYVLIKIFSTIFFAYNDTRTPVKIGLFAIGVNISLNIALFFILKHIGIALATSMAAWFNAISLACFLYKKKYITFDTHLKQRLVRIVMASIIMSLTLMVGKNTFKLLEAPHFFDRFLILACLIALGTCVYFLSAVLLKAVNIKEILFYFSNSKEIK